MKKDNTSNHLITILCCEEYMIHAVKKIVTVQEDGSIRLYVPEFKKGTVAEVIILESSESATKKHSFSHIIGTGKGGYSSPDEVDTYIAQERSSWE
jgi:hypothetical protein